MEEATAKAKSKIVGEWVIRDKDGNIKEQGTDGMESTQEEGGGEEAEK